MQRIVDFYVKIQNINDISEAKMIIEKIKLKIDEINQQIAPKIVETESVIYREENK